MMRRRTALLTVAGGALVLAGGRVVTASRPPAPPAAPTVSPLLNSVAVGPYPDGVAVDESTGRAFVSNQDGTIQVLDTHTGAQVRKVTVGGAFHTMATVQGLGCLFVVAITSSGVGASVSALDARTGRLVRTVTMGSNPHGLAVDGRAGRVYVGVNGGVTMFDARTGAPLRTIRLPVRGVSAGVALDARTGRLFVAQEGVTATGLVPIQGGASTVSTIDLHSEAVLRTVPVGTEPHLSALDERTGRLFLVSTMSMRVDILDTRSGAVARTVPLGGAGLEPDAIAQDTQAGRVLLVSSGNGHGGAGHVTLLDARTGTTIRTTAVGQYPWAAAVDERRSRAYVVSNSGAYVLDTRTGAVLRSLAILGGRLALDRRAQRLIVLGAVVPVPNRGRPEPAWERGLRRWAPWLRQQSADNSTIHALTLDVSRQ